MKYPCQNCVIEKRKLKISQYSFATEHWLSCKNAGLLTMVTVGDNSHTRERIEEALLLMCETKCKYFKELEE